MVVETNFGDGTVCELIRKIAAEMSICIAIDEESVSGQKEARIIDTIEPVMNQHRLVVNRSIIEWDYNSNEELPIEECMAHRLAHQLSYLNRTRNCLRHDGRLEAASGAVRRFRDSLNISAALEIERRKREDWEDFLQGEIDDPQPSVEALARGFNLEQRRAARALREGYYWLHRR